MSYADAGRLGLGYRCARSGMTIAVAADHRIETDQEHELRLSHEDDLAKLALRVEATEGSTVRVEKLVCLPLLPRGARCASCPTGATAPSTAAAGTASTTTTPSSASWYDHFWRRADVQVDGEEATQQAIRFNVFIARPGHRPLRPAGRARQGTDRLRLRGPLLLGHRGLRRPVPELHAARRRPQRPPLPHPDAADRPRTGPRDGPERRALPVAHDQRRGGVGLLRGRHRRGAHRRRHRLRAHEVRARLRRRGVPGARRHRPAGRDRPDVGGPRLLAHQRASAPSTSTGSPAPTSTPPSSTTTCSPT